MRQVIRCRARVGGQGKPRGDGKPAGPDRPLEKGGRGIEIGHQMPAEEQRSGGHVLLCARRPDVPP